MTSDERQRLRNLLLIPATAILFFENDQIACLIDTSIAA